MSPTSPSLITPHGGELVNRIIPGEEQDEWLARAQSAQSFQVDAITLSDLELIATGVVSPLTGFMGQDDYESVLTHMRLANNLVWPLPFTLRTEQDARWQIGQDIALTETSGQIIGVMKLEETYLIDPEREAMAVYGTTDPNHPGVALGYQRGRLALAGPVWLFQRTTVDFPDFCYTPAQLRAQFTARGWRQIVAFQTRNPIHRAHEYLQKTALEIVDGLLLHPLMGPTKDDDIPASIRMETYRVMIERYFPAERVMLATFPAAMRYAGPREAIFHALCRRNYGCTHFIVGRDHAGIGPYYGTYDAQLVFDQFAPDEIGIVPLRFEHAFYSKREQTIVTAKTSIYGPEDWLHLSGSQVRDILQRGEMLPPEFTRPEVAEILRRAYMRKSTHHVD